MSNPAPNPFRLVLIPAILTLIVSVVRVYGELQGWDPMWFANDAPGSEDASLGLLGITWLVPIFGVWFGLRLRRATGQPAKLGRAAVLHLVGIVVVGGLFAAFASGAIKTPTADDPGTPGALYLMLGGMLVGAVLALVAWPRLGGLLLVYGLLARIPVVVITWLAIDNDWDTHHAKLPVNTELPPETTKLAFLIMPQLTFWIVFTMLIGGLFGCLGATLGTRRS